MSKEIEKFINKLEEAKLILAHNPYTPFYIKIVKRKFKGKTTYWKVPISYDGFFHHYKHYEIVMSPNTHKELEKWKH